jgi:glycosyltransferase involved in cell wall biosynthesis
MQHRFPRDQRAIGFATFETFEPPDSWITALNKNDAIICPSKFNYKIFAHSKIDKPIFYIPHCFDITRFNDQVIPMEKKQKFTFLYFGTWKKRKGWNILIEAFLKSFTMNDEVQLLIKTDKANIAEADIKKMQDAYSHKKDLPPIVLERRIYDSLHLSTFLKSVHCLVSPTLGEGFGLPGLQCMALGVPIIITNFAGCQDYANSDTCTLLEPLGFVMHENMDSISQFANRKWPYITVDALCEAMLQVHNQYEKACFKAKIGYKYVHENFNYTVVAKAYQEMMEILYRAN